MTDHVRPLIIVRSAAVFLLALAIGRTAAAAVKIDLKLSGGFARLLERGGDLEATRTSNIGYYLFIGNQPGYSGNWNWKEMAYHPDFEADLVFRLGIYFGLSLGSGYLYGSSHGKLSYTYDYSGTSGGTLLTANALDENAHDYEIRTVPIKAGLHVYLPLRGCRFFGYAGAGYYFGKLTHDRTEDYQFSSDTVPPSAPEERREIANRFVLNESGTCRALGFHGGVGFEIDLFAFLSLGLEAFGRSLKFDNWIGEETDTWDSRDRYWRADKGWYIDDTTHQANAEHGTWWASDFYESWMGDYTRQMMIHEEPPTGSHYRNPRPASVNFDAWGAAASLVIHLNLLR
jgi:hypothetical protein